MSWRFKQKLYLDQETKSTYIRDLSLSGPYKPKCAMGWEKNKQTNLSIGCILNINVANVIFNNAEED